MNKFMIYISLLLLIVFANEALAQRGDPNLRRIGYHTGNRIGISYYNDGQISGFNQGVDIRGEWPLGSGDNYIGDCIPLIGVEFTNLLGEVKHSVCISRGPRKGQFEERHPTLNYFWGWNPLPGFLNPAAESVAMSHLPDSWPIGGWKDQPTWVDTTGKTQWNGYFGRGIIQADQESYYWADDNQDDEFNGNFNPDSTDTSRKGMGLTMGVRGFQWSSFLAANSIFWLYDIKNEGTTIFRKADFGMVVGTLVGGDGDSGDDLGRFEINNSITYSWDSDNSGNKGQRVGYVGYAFLESPGNPFDGIDNDDDSGDPNAPKFIETSFDSVTYFPGSVMVLIDANTYARTQYTVTAGDNTVTSLGKTTTFTPGVTYFREGHIKEIVNGVSMPDLSANDGIDNDFDGLIDENEAIHFEARKLKTLPGLKYKDFKTGLAVNAPLIDERRDNDAGVMTSSLIKLSDGSVVLMSHWSGDENANWVGTDIATGDIRDDVGSDGVGPYDEGYLGSDADGTEGNGRPDQGEPNFGKTDPDESDQIGLTSFNFFEQASSPDLSQDEILWSRMFPGRFDVIPSNTPQDGDFIYSSGYFPLAPNTTERFSVSLLFGQDLADVVRQKNVVQQIYNAGYKFPQPPRKPKISITQDDGKVILYWDPRPVENSIDFMSKLKDFEGYKIYRATDAGFIDSRTITNAYGVLFFNKPLRQYDIKGNGIKGFFYPRPELLEQLGGVTYYLGDDTTGLTNRFIDSSAVKGQTYYYAVAAYDKGDAEKNIFPSENSTFIFRSNTGAIISDDNTGYITPGARPIGYVDASLESLTAETTPRGTGKVMVEVIDQSAINPKNTYRIVFADTSLQRYTESWSLVNITTGDTLIKKTTTFGGSTPVVDGFRLQIANDEIIKLDANKTGWYINGQDTVPAAGVSGSAEFPQLTFETFNVVLSGITNSGIVWADDYYLEFSPDSTYGRSIADTLRPPTPSNRIPAKNTNFKVKRIVDGSEVPFVYYQTGQQSTVHNIYFKENINGIVYRTWRLNISMNAVGTPLPTSGQLKVFTKKPFSSSDSYRFNMKSSSINSAAAANELEKIKVVPNPYVVTHQNEARLLSTQTSGRGEREIRFTHIPPGSKINIFTVKGELIKTLLSADQYVGDVYWNLRTEENLDAAFGMYVYTVEIPNVGTKIGKFALIK